jgi:hypothetical protein
VAENPGKLDLPGVLVKPHKSRKLGSARNLFINFFVVHLTFLQNNFAAQRISSNICAPPTISVIAFITSVSFL